MDDPAPPQCLGCAHFWRFEVAERGLRFLCDAYPDGDGVPTEIVENTVAHTKPYKGDHGIQFVRRA